MSKQIAKLQLQTDELIKQIMSSKKNSGLNESPEQREKRIVHLLNNWQEFMKYYFPKLCKSDFAPFQIRGINAALKFKRKKSVFAWMCSRALAKTTVWQMAGIYLNCRAIRGMDHGYKTCIWWSKTAVLAIDSLRLIRGAYEYNDDLIRDFGKFRTETSIWTDEKFVTSQGITWKAIGKGQSPRGTKDEDAIRPDLIIGDDFDDDVEVLNEQRLDKSYNWAMGALWPTMDISTEGLFVVLNNLIGEDSLMARFWQIADYKEKVNLLDENGVPSWPQRHELTDCQQMISKMGTLLAQREYFNNPVTEGKVFRKEWIRYKKMEDLRAYQALVAYLDPSFSAKKNADHKSWVLMGLLNGEIHVVKAYCDRATIESMVAWGYEIEDYCKRLNGSPQLWMEEVFFQSILYKDFNAAAKTKGYSLPLRGDTRKKPDKDQRIMSLAGYFERGQWYFNEAERSNHHMENLIFQFTSYQPGHTGIKKDGPDACEGGEKKLIEVLGASQGSTHGARRRPKNMY